MNGRFRRIGLGLLWFLSMLLVLATLLPILDSDAWWIRNLTFPQAQITVVMVVLLVLAVAVAGRRGAAGRIPIAGLAAAIGYQLFYLLPYTPLAGRTVADAGGCPAGDRLRLLEANVKAGNDRHGPILAMVRRERPDLFFAVETDDAWRRALNPLRATYTFVVVAPRDDYWGMMLFSRRPLSDARVEHLVDGYVPSIRATVTLASGKRFVFHGMHPRPPMFHGSTEGDADLVRAGLAIAREREPAVLAGDLNDVPWAATTRLFGKVSGMRDPRVGRGFLASFDADSTVLRWPLDHVFVSPGFRVGRFAPRAGIGSDHFPMLADLCLAGEAEAAAAGADAWRRARQVVGAGRRAATP